MVISLGKNFFCLLKTQLHIFVASVVKQKLVMTAYGHSNLSRIKQCKSSRCCGTHLESQHSGT